MNCNNDSEPEVVRYMYVEPGVTRGVLPFASSVFFMEDSNLSLYEIIGIGSRSKVNSLFPLTYLQQEHIHE